MSTILLHNIGDKNRGFNFRLTKNYWFAKVSSIALDYLRETLNKLINKTLFRIEEIRVLLEEVYKEAEHADPKEAEEALRFIVTLRKSITKQNKKFSSIDYAESLELGKAFTNLVRLINRIEARVQSRIYSNSEVNKTPDYIKEKMTFNSKKAVSNALLQEANY